MPHGNPTFDHIYFQIVARQSITTEEDVEIRAGRPGFTNPRLASHVLPFSEGILKVQQARKETWAGKGVLLDLQHQMKEQPQKTLFFCGKCTITIGFTQIWLL